MATGRYRTFPAVIAAIALMAAGAPGFAGDQLLSAAEAWEMADQGRITVIDVRTPGEWRATGIARGARVVNLLDPRGEAGFVDRMTQAVGGDRSRPVALICARGNRSTRAQDVLERAGFTNVYNIVEGMLGRDGAKGWLAGGLPVESCAKC